MNKKSKAHYRPLFIALLIMTTVVLTSISSVGFAAEPTVNLGTASSFAILAGSTITNTGPTTVKGTAGGNIGLHPGDDPTIETFPGQVDISLTGTVHLFDAVAEQAKVDLVTAYNDAASRSSDETISADLGGRTLTSGVYSSASSIGLTGTLTLDAEGDPNAVFIFQMGSTLTTASNSEVRLINGAQACRVFWQVGSSATLGTDSYFVGHIFAMESITATNGVEVQGQLLARNGAVTLDTNIIDNYLCLTPGSLRVTKEVAGLVNGMTLPAFEITVTGPFDFNDTQTIAAGESYTWDGLASGTYTVSEGELSTEWESSGTGEYQVPIGEVTDVTITNTYTADETPIYGALTVTKVVAGDIGDMTLPLYSITVTGPEGFTATRTFENGESYTWTDLVPGVYTVTEDKTGFSSEWTVSGEGTVTVTADQTAVTTIANTYSADEGIIYGALTVTKVVAGDIGDMTLPVYSITITGPEGFTATRTFVDGESFTWTDLIPGEYTVTENKTGFSSEWTVSGEGGVTVTADQTAVATITNTYTAEEEIIYGALTVTKVVTGDYGDMTLPLYSITVTGPEGFTATRTFVHGESFTWTNLVPGVYTVTENKTGFSSEWTVSGEGAVTVTADQTAVRTVTNAFVADEAELPATGGETLYTAYAGIILFGLSVLMRRVKK